MKFGKQQYKRLTFVLLFPLLLLGLFLALDGYFVKEQAYIVECYVYYDDKKKFEYKPDCKIIEDYSSGGYIFNNILLNVKNSDIQVEVRKESFNTDIGNFVGKYGIRGIKINKEAENGKHKFEGLEEIAANDGYGLPESISGYVTFYDKDEESSFFKAIDAGKSIEFKIDLRQMAEKYLPMFIPLIMYFLFSFLLLILIRIIKYILNGKSA